jgi:hypothetical protein
MPDFTWTELISSFTDDCEFAPPANEAEIAAAEQSLGLSLPLSLRSLLKESNGINGLSGLGVVWEVSAIALTNIQFRSNFKDLYMPFDGLLFFGDGGNGDQFAYPLLNNIAEVQIGNGAQNRCATISNSSLAVRPSAACSGRYRPAASSRQYRKGPACRPAL